MSSEHYFNPFPGLRSFEEEEEYLFFGREQQVDNLLSKIDSTHFLAVVGASGSGKSSLVKCGLLPSFHSGFLKGVGNGWRIGVFRPGDDPIGNLAQSFCSEELIGIEEGEESGDRQIIESILRRSDDGINNVVDQYLNNTEENLLLVVDQFEELFRFSKYERKSNKGARDSVVFINLLLKAIKDKSKRLYVVITMRSDFLGNCTEFRGLPEAINEGQYLIPRMNRNEKKLAISGPVAVGGAEISSPLVALLLNEVGDNPDQLPIMQHALMRTWDYWTNNSTPETPIDVVHYEAIGKMANALSFHADEAYNELGSNEEKELCAKLFKSLTETGTALGGVRRPTKLVELEKLLEAPKETLVKVIDAFREKGRSFLMPPEGVELTDETVIDISHESLMRVWKRLDAWVQEEAESAETYKSIANAAALFQESKGGLYRDPELQFALLWFKKNKPTESWAVRYDNSFVRAITFLEQSKEDNEFEIAQKELMQKRRIKRNQLFTIVLSVLVIVSLALSIWSFIERQKAEEANKFAQDKKVEAEESAESARKSAKEAQDQKQIALGQKAIADTAKLEAEQNQKMAEENAKRADEQKKRAEDLTVLAENEKENAVKAQNDAVDARNMALENERKATQLRGQAEAKNLAYESTLKLEKGLRSDARQLALDAYELNDSSKGDFLVDDIYVAMTRGLYSGDSLKANILGDYKLQVKDIAVNPINGSVAFVDEQGRVTIASKPTGIRFIKDHTISIDSESRAITFSTDGNHLMVGDYQGRIHQFKKMGDGKYAPTTTKIIRSSSIINRISFVKVNNQEILVAETNKGTDFFNYSQEGLTPLNYSNNSITPTKFLMLDYSKCAFVEGEVLYTANIELRSNEIKLTVQSSKDYNEKITELAYLKGTKSLAVGLKRGSVHLIQSDDFQNEFRNVVSHNSHVSGLDFLVYGGNKYLVSSSYDGTGRLVYLNDIKAKKKEVVKLDGSYFHSGWVHNIKPSGDGRYFFTSSKDGTVKMWFTRTADLYNYLQN